jgi:anti-sigma factor RsiW
MSLTHADIDARLIEFLYGELDAGARRAFEEHLAGCDRCRAEVTSLGDVRADARAAVRRDLIEDPPPAVQARVMDAALKAAAAMRPPSPASARAQAAAAAAPQAASEQGVRGFLRWLRRPWILPTFGTVTAVMVVLVMRATVFQEGTSPLSADQAARLAEREPAASRVAAPPVGRDIAAEGDLVDGLAGNAQVVEKPPAPAAAAPDSSGERRRAEMVLNQPQKEEARAAIRRSAAKKAAGGAASSARSGAHLLADESDYRGDREKNEKKKPNKASGDPADSEFASEDLDGRALAKGGGPRFEPSTPPSGGSLSVPARAQAASEALAAGAGERRDRDKDQSQASAPVAAATPPPPPASVSLTPPPGKSVRSYAQAPPPRPSPAPAEAAPVAASASRAVAAKPAARVETKSEEKSEGQALAARTPETKADTAHGKGAYQAYEEEAPEPAPGQAVTGNKGGESAAVLAGRAEKLAAAGRWSEAVATYRELLRRFPQHASVPAWRQRMAAAESELRLDQGGQMQQADEAVVAKRKAAPKRAAPATEASKAQRRAEPAAASPSTSTSKASKATIDAR